MPWTVQSAVVHLHLTLSSEPYLSPAQPRLGLTLPHADQLPTSALHSSASPISSQSWAPALPGMAGAPWAAGRRGVCVRIGTLRARAALTQEHTQAGVPPPPRPPQKLRCVRACRGRQVSRGSVGNMQEAGMPLGFQVPKRWSRVLSSRLGGRPAAPLEALPLKRPPHLRPLAATGSAFPDFRPGNPEVGGASCVPRALFPGAGDAEPATSSCRAASVGCGFRPFSSQPSSAAAP